MKYVLSAFFLCLLSVTSDGQAQSNEPVKVVVAGLTHDHVHWIFDRKKSDAIEIVGISEPNEELRQRYIRQYDLDEKLFYSDLQEALDSVEPEAVTAFGSVYNHLKVVEASAPRDIHVMVEKPLAVNWEHARRMEALAEKHDIYLLTNYETSWYASNHRAYEMIHEEQRFGDIRKMVVHDGHQGPKEIGVSDEFLEWLTDPKFNGGGALMDFGCYGANLITWLMNGEEPVEIQAVTQQIKPETYPKVEDEATIILTYPKAQGIIQASWNWPYNRKDMQVYGQTGYVFAENDQQIRYMEDGERSEEELDNRPTPYDSPFNYFASVIRGETEVKDTDLSSLANNMIVMKILEAAKISAKTGEAVNLEEEF